jgi:hypothetical protein
MGSELSGPVLRCRRRAEGVCLVCAVESDWRDLGNGLSGLFRLFSFFGLFRSSDR